jgi:hypothetical protein
VASIGRLVLAGCLTITLAGFASAQSLRSLTDTVSEDAAAKAHLHEQLLLTREAIRNLTESLALANSEAEVFKRQAEDLQVKFDALAPSSGEQKKLEERLLAATNELAMLQKENALLLERILALAEGVQAFMKTAEAADPEARALLEKELRMADRFMGLGANDIEPSNAGPTLTDASVVEVKPDFALVVANIGRNSGVRVGMPFQVWRNNRRIGEVRVIDVRDRVSGAVVQNLVSEENQIQTGDRLRVDAHR